MLVNQQSAVFVNVLGGKVKVKAPEVDEVIAEFERALTAAPKVISPRQAVLLEALGVRRGR